MADATAQSLRAALRDLPRRAAQRLERRCPPDARQSDEFVAPRKAQELVAPADAGAMDLVYQFRAIASLLIWSPRPKVAPRLFPVRPVSLASRPARQA